MSLDKSRPWFVFNAASAKVAKKGALLPTLAKAHNAVLRDVGDFSDVDILVQDALKAQAEHIVIEGGDGTVQGILTEFLRHEKARNLPIFTLVPGGNTNQVARNIGLNTATPPALAKALSHDNTIIQAPLLRIKDKAARKYYGFLFSSGALPQVTDYTKDKLHDRGIGGSMAVIGGILKGVSGDGGVMQPTKVKLNIKADGVQKLRGPHLGTIVTTLPGLMLGLDPFWGEGERPLRVTYVAGDYQKLMRNVASLWLGKKKDRSQDGMYSWTADGLKYRYKGPCVLDGELLDLTKGFKISATRPIRFAR